jgi:HAD superfamily hydrolase (TIGR01509 family)
MTSAYLDPPEGARALVFDCDGTLVDTMGLHRVVWADLFSDHGFTITDEWWEEMGNVALEPFVRAAVPAASDALIARLRDDSIEMFDERLHLLEPLEHVVEVARRFHGVLPLAVCSGGFRVQVLGALDAVGITHLFDHVVAAEDVVNGKPAPDLYLLVMERLGVGAREVVVYEDSEIGMASAAAAGVTCIRDVRRA